MVKARSRESQGKESKDKGTSRQDQGTVKVRSWQGQCNVKGKLSQGQGKVEVRSRQQKHRLNRNYNLMGFDTIEINLFVYHHDQLF